MSVSPKLVWPRPMLVVPLKVTGTMPQIVASAAI